MRNLLNRRILDEEILDYEDPPNNCRTCMWYKEGLCLKTKSEIPIEEICDDYWD